MTVAEKKRRQTLIDEYCELRGKHKALGELLEHKKAEVFAFMPEGLADSEPCTLHGKNWILLIKACKWVREIISKRAVFDRVGEEAFLENCTFPLKAFDDLIPETERSTYCKRERTGAREVESVPKNA